MQVGGFSSELNFLTSPVEILELSGDSITKL